MQRDLFDFLAINYFKQIFMRIKQSDFNYFFLDFKRDDECNDFRMMYA